MKDLLFYGKIQAPPEREVSKMIPAQITDDVFNCLRWTKKEASCISEELEGYSILGVEVSSDWVKTDGEQAVSGLILYLQAENSSQIKVVCLDTWQYLLDEMDDDIDENNTDPISVLVARVDMGTLDRGRMTTEVEIPWEI